MKSLARLSPPRALTSITGQHRTVPQAKELPTQEQVPGSVNAHMCTHWHVSLQKNREHLGHGKHFPAQTLHTTFPLRDPKLLLISTVEQTTPVKQLISKDIPLLQHSEQAYPQHVLPICSYTPSNNGLAQL